MLRIRTRGRRTDFLLLSRLFRAFRHAVRVLFPDACRGCGIPLPWDRPWKGMNRLLCPACQSGLVPIAAPVCTRCGIPFSGGENHLCGRCIERTPAYDKARCAVLFEGPVMDMVHRFKYSSRTDLAHPLALLLLPVALRFGAPLPDLVIPVPLHPDRLRSRGYNQAGLLASRLQEMLPSTIMPRRDRDALIRVRETGSQTGLDREARRRNVKDAFRARGVAGKHVWLVDDVLTTGATADSAARALRSGGAASVRILCVARTP